MKNLTRRDWMRWLCFVGWLICALVWSVFPIQGSSFRILPLGAGLGFAVGILLLRLAKPSRFRAVGTVLGLAAAWPLLGSFAAMQLSQRVAGDSGRCQLNVRDLSFAVFAYSSDFDERFPPADRWRSVTRSALRDPEAEHRCPRASGRWTYAFNDQLSGMSRDRVGEPETVMLFETDGATVNVHGGSNLAAFRHSSHMFVGLVGEAVGTLKSTAGDLPQRWKP